MLAIAAAPISSAMIPARSRSLEMSLLMTACRMNGALELTTTSRAGSVGRMAAGIWEATTAADPGLVATMRSAPLPGGPQYLSAVCSGMMASWSRLPHGGPI
jgi:hypothetical protein